MPDLEVPLSRQNPSATRTAKPPRQSYFPIAAIGGQRTVIEAATRRICLTARNFATAVRLRGWPLRLTASPTLVRRSPPGCISYSGCVPFDQQESATEIHPDSQLLLQLPLAVAFGAPTGQLANTASGKVKPLRQLGRRIVKPTKLAWQSLKTPVPADARSTTDADSCGDGRCWKPD